MENLLTWRYFVGWCDAGLYSNPIDTDPDYLKGFADSYREMECAGGRS